MQQGADVPLMMGSVLSLQLWLLWLLWQVVLQWMQSLQWLQ